MVTLFANNFRAPVYEHLIGSLAYHFYEVMRIAERNEQGIRNRRVMEPVEKSSFVGKKKEIKVNNLEDRYRGKERNY